MIKPTPEEKPSLVTALNRISDLLDRAQTSADSLHVLADRLDGGVPSTGALVPNDKPPEELVHTLHWYLNRLQDALISIGIAGSRISDSIGH